MRGLFHNFSIDMIIKVLDDFNYRSNTQTLLKFDKTRTKTSIRYAKENDREEGERKKGRRRDI